MHFTRRYFKWSTILIFALIVLEIITIIIFNNKLNYYQKINHTLESTVNTQIEVAQDLTFKNNDLSDKVSQLKEENSLLIEENNRLSKEKIKLEEEIDNLKRTIQELSSATTNKDFKSFMPYTAITDKASKQWELQQQATTNEYGFRCIDGRPLVAVGTGWGLSVGDYATISCDNGNSFEVVIGDIKADAHTMTDNKTTASNSCRCEFIVDINNLHQDVKKCGNVAVLPEYSGYVVSIK